MFEPITFSATDHHELIELSKVDNLPFAYIRAIERKNIAISIESTLYLVPAPSIGVRERLCVGQRYSLEPSFFKNVVTFVQAPET